MQENPDSATRSGYETRLRYIHSRWQDKNHRAKGHAMHIFLIVSIRNGIQNHSYRLRPVVAIPEPQIILTVRRNQRRSIPHEGKPHK